MIYAVTFNPSLDMVFALPPGLPPGDTYNHVPWMAHAGGKGNNVARAIKQLGGPVTAVGFYGGVIGQTIQQLLSQQQISSLTTAISGSSRVCLTLLTDSVREMRGEGPTISPHTSRTLLERLRQQLTPSDWVTLSGSLPPGLSADDVKEWVRCLRPHCQGIIADLAGDNLIAACEAGVTAICPNAAEYQDLLAKSWNAYPVHVVVTEGPRGVLWHPPNGDPPQRIYAPTVPERNPVGAGDVLVGILAYGLWQGQDWPHALMRAVAAASASVVTKGVADIDQSLLKQLIPQVSRGSP